MFNLGVIFQDAGDTTSAKEHYLEVLKIDPHYTEARVNMAIILEKEGLNQIAYTQYKDALKLSPNEPKIFSNLGINRKRAG